MKQKITAADHDVATDVTSPHVTGDTIGVVFRWCVLPSALVLCWICLSFLFKWGVAAAVLGVGVIAASACIMRRYAERQKSP